MKRTQILVWAVLIAVAGCKSSDDGGGNSGGTGGIAAGAGGIAAGTGGIAAGTGGIAAGTGGNAAGTGGTTAGTGGTTAGTGGTTAGTGGTTAGTGGTTAGTGGGMASQACIDGAATASGVDPVTEMECISCLCTADEAAVAACNAECWDLVLCVRDHNCYSCAGELDMNCALTNCQAEAFAGNANADANAFLPTINMCLPQCIPGC